MTYTVRAEYVMHVTYIKHLLSIR